MENFGVNRLSPLSFEYDNRLYHIDKVVCWLLLYISRKGFSSYVPRKRKKPTTSKKID